MPECGEKLSQDWLMNRGRVNGTDDRFYDEVRQNGVN
jgi:hypothetical protein